MAALQNGVAIDIDNIDGREWSRTPESVQLGQHLVAQLTVVTMDDCQTHGVRGHVKAVLLVMRAGLYGVGYEAHRGRRHFAYRRHLVTVDDG